MVNTTPLTAGRFVGQKVLRKEDPRLLTGRGRYIDDVVLPGMLHAHFVRSDVARARITRLDVDAARDADGVVAVFTGADLNDQVAGSMYPSMFQGAEDFMAPMFPLAVDDVRFVGDPIALIIAAEPLPRRGRGRARRDRLRAARRRSSTTSQPRPTATTGPPEPTRQRRDADGRSRSRRGRRPCSTAPRTSSRRASCSTATAWCRWSAAASWRAGSRSTSGSTCGSRARTRTRRGSRSAASTGRAREQRPGADRRRRRRLRPEVVRRPRRDQTIVLAAYLLERRSSGSRTGARTSSRPRTRAPRTIDDHDGGRRRRHHPRLRRRRTSTTRARTRCRGGSRRPARRHALHRAVPGPAPRLVTHHGLHEHLRQGRVPRAVDDGDHRAASR